MSTIVLLSRLFAVLAGFRLLGWPIARRILPGLPATSYALATTTALVLSAHVTWLLVQAGMRLGALSIGLGIAAVAAVSLAALRELGRRGDTLRPRLPDVLSHHGALALAFCLALLITARNPSIDPDSERPMDYAMVNAVVASRSLPLEDPWLAGERVAYYDYGYYATAHLALLVGPVWRFFPVAVALLFAALFAGVLALGRDLAGWRGGLLAAWFVGLAGNLDAVAQTLRHGLDDALNWFQSARVVAGAITEFPFFTLLWGDLHPYALALPLWPILLAVAVAIWRGTATLGTLLVGATGFAQLLATHSWDAVPAAALLGLAALVRGRARPRPLGSPLTVVALGCLLALPFLLHAPTGGRGLGIVSRPSTLRELFTAWGVQAAILAVAALSEASVAVGSRESQVSAAIFIAALAIAWLPAAGAGLAAAAALACLALAWRCPGHGGGFAWLLAAVGAGLVAGVEVFYVDDFYSGELERMNTVFKAYVEAWLCLSLAAGLHLALLIERARGAGRSRRILALALVVLSVSASAVYPLRAVPARSGNLLHPRGLDAREALRERYPEDAALVERLRQLPRGIILETTGDPYTWNGRFATFTGYPTVVGWGHHEAGWRNQWEPMLERSREVKQAYEAETLEPLLLLAARHGVTYVVVGQLEREQYPKTLAKFSSLRRLLSEGESVVYEAPR